MHRVLLIDDNHDHAEQLGRVLGERGYIVTRTADCEAAIARLGNRTTVYDVVILWITGRQGSWREALRDLQHAGRKAGLQEAPLFLCASHLHLGIDTQLQIERMGARYAWEE